MKEFAKEQYILPEIKVDFVENDVITFSEEADGGNVWDGPLVDDEEEP